MNYSDTSDSDPETGRFKSTKSKEICRKHISYEKNSSNHQKQVPMVAEKQKHFRRERISEDEQSPRLLTRESKTSKFTERTSDHTSTVSFHSRKEERTNVGSSKQYMKSRRSHSVDRNCSNLVDEKNKKYISRNQHNRNEVSQHSQEKKNNVSIKSHEKMKHNSREKGTQDSRHSRKIHSPQNDLKKQEKFVENECTGFSKHRSSNETSFSDHRSESSHKSTSLHDNVSFGPALPPVEIKSNQIVGPVLPLEFKLSSPSSSQNVQEKTTKSIGPQIPNNLKELIQFQTEHDFEKVSSSEEEQEDDCSFTIGPMPVGSITLTAAQLELEKRALEIKIKKLDDAEMGSSSKNRDEREEWMIELPEIRKVADFGLGARQFRTKERPDFDDRTQWTSTPQVESNTKRKEQKVDLKKAQEKLLQTARDREQDKMAINHKKKNKRDASLMDIHKKKLKKESEKKNTTVGRRPFDRDLDLQANRFDEARNKATVRKAALLDTRFASSKQGKYL